MIHLVAAVLVIAGAILCHDKRDNWFWFLALAAIIEARALR